MEKHIKNLHKKDLIDLIEIKGNLAELLETDDELNSKSEVKWNFERYLKKVEEMLSKKIIKIDTINEIKKAIKDYYDKPSFKLN